MPEICVRFSPDPLHVSLSLTPCGFMDELRNGDRKSPTEDPGRKPLASEAKRLAFSMMCSVYHERYPIRHPTIVPRGWPPVCVRRTPSWNGTDRSGGRQPMVHVMFTSG